MKALLGTVEVLGRGRRALLRTADLLVRPRQAVGADAYGGAHREFGDEDVMVMTEIAPGRVDLCANVDGPWPRTGEEAFAVQLEVLFGRLRAISDQPADSYTGPEQFTLGVKDAAAWTLGVTAKAPFRPGETAVGDATVTRCLGDAELLIQTGTLVEFYAAGVRAWLRWLAALDDAVEYPEG